MFEKSIDISRLDKEQRAAMARQFLDHFVARDGSRELREQRNSFVDFLCDADSGLLIATFLQIYLQDYIARQGMYAELERFLEEWQHD